MLQNYVLCSRDQNLILPDVPDPLHVDLKIHNNVNYLSSVRKYLIPMAEEFTEFIYRDIGSVWPPGVLGPASVLIGKHGIRTERGCRDACRVVGLVAVSKKTVAPLYNYAQP